MDLYKVLLVDDEEEVYSVIMKKLDWEGLGFKIAGYARNGVEALDMAEELQVDVVMTDIKMPYMDGLTLARKLKEQYKNIKVIIFSGFDEFEYAREAIKIEAEEYILKPINADELKKVFERIKENLDRELDEKRNIDKLREYYNASLPMLQEHFFISLLDGRLTTEQIARHMNDYQIDFKEDKYLVSALHVTTPEEDEALDQTLLTFAVRRLAGEELENKDTRIVTYLGDTVVIAGVDENSLSSFTDKMDRLCKTARRVCGAKVTAGIGYVVNSLPELPASYQGARNAISYRVLYGTGRAISISEIDPMEDSDSLWEETYIADIIKKIKMGAEQPLYASIESFMTKLEATRMSLQKYQIIIMEIITEVFRLAVNNQVNMEELIGGNSDMYTKALSNDTTEALKRWLYNSCSKLMLQIVGKRKDTTKSFVENAVEFVKENYANPDLDIDAICSHLNVSAAYFSTIFKKETGKTFINFLTEYRMQAAVELLLGENDKTYVIAEKVGYTDPNYFSYVFKKQYGMSPSKYRTAMLEDK